jgi:hypothetical protein
MKFFPELLIMMLCHNYLGHGLKRKKNKVSHMSLNILGFEPHSRTTYEYNVLSLINASVCSQRGPGI